MEKLPRATRNLYGISLEINRGETRWYMKILRVENVREEGKRAAVYRGESFRLFASDAVLAWPMERRRLPKSAERAEGDRAGATEIKWIR